MTAFEKFIPAAPLLRLGRSAPQLQQINKDDLVLVLPAMFAGSVDFKNSPVGRIEGGFYHVSVINSILSNSPLIPVLSGNWSLLIILMSLGAVMLFACTKMKIKTGLAVMILSALTVVVCGLLGFVYYSYLADWHILSAFLVLDGGTLLAVRAIREERQSQLIETALEGMVSPEVLQNIKSNPSILYKRPKELNLSVLFIDIEGFSLRTRESLSVDVFTILHAQLDMITHFVHAYGGVVDRILGDGLMCFFGFSFEDDGIQSLKPSEHAWRAVRCAIDIQREAARVTAQTQNPCESLGSVVPLRIGINTGDVFLGNLGSGKRLDFTIVGNTVNMAKRHEDACETFRILMGPETYKHLQSHPDFSHSDALDIRPRLLALKHHEDLVIGWECDPFTKNPELFTKATEKVKDAIGNSIPAQLSKPQLPIMVRVNKMDEGNLSNFHFERMTIITKDYYCKKVYLNVEFRPQSKAMAKKLAEAHLKSIYVQVFTGSPASEITYTHVVKVAHLTQDKLNQLHEILSSIDEPSDGQRPTI
ncbi:adenylate/guanylate cyclase domain-containing protein [bacterium]|nr:adenylate/guanylate cyclase domain-containing protein [bacterium]